MSGKSKKSFSYSAKIEYITIFVFTFFCMFYVISHSCTFPKKAQMDAVHSYRHQCTSFCLDNNGYAVFGTNYDHGKNIYEGLIFVNKRNVSKSYWESDAVSEHARWTSKYGSVTFNLVMSQFAWAGMNEAGLVISTMELVGSQSPAPDKRFWIYSNYWVQYILDNYSTVEEVIDSDSLIRIKDYVDHYLISDKNGNCATIEFLEGKMVYHTGANLPVKVLTNNDYERSAAEWNRTMMHKSQGESIPIQNQSLYRFVLAADMVTEFKSIDTKSAVKYAFDVLEKVSGQNVNGSPTLWSIVFDTKNLRIFFRTIKHSEVRYINFQGLDFSCKTPVKMLDVNEKLTGDITNKLKEYSSQLHFNHALHAGKRWGDGADPETLRWRLRFLEKFHCEDY